MTGWWRPCTASVVLAGAVVLSGVALQAHDMWIEPASFRPNTGDIVALRLRVGQDLLGDPLPHEGRLIESFVIDDADGRRPVVGRDGGDPAGLVRVASTGLAVLGYHSRPSIVEMTAEKFAQYLDEEGLDAIAGQRRQRQQLSLAARDAFTRCAKSLVLTGQPSAAQHDRALGLPLELIAERNPYALGDDRDLPVRLTWQGRPLAGALVVAINRRKPGEKQRLRSDRDGRVVVHIDSGGTWLIKAVHMQAAASGSGVDWESYWASLTFAPEARPLSSAGVAGDRR